MTKKFFVTLVLIASLLPCVAFKTPEREVGNYYPRAFVVDKLDYEKDIVTVVDAVGMKWKFTECDDWEVGDMVVAIMDSKGTEIITDDSFVEICFAGYIDPIPYWSYD